MSRRREQPERTERERKLWARFGPDQRAVPGDEAFEQWWTAAGRDELSQLLLWRWDPLGVADFFPAARDEYDSYIRPLVELLRDGGGSSAVVGLLLEIERDAMGDVHEHADRQLGETIVEWYAASREHHGA